VAKLSHPNIVTVFDFGQLDDGTYYLASELVTGVTLREHLRSGPLARRARSTSRASSPTGSRARTRWA
jgi:serine/threonine protein kinase